MQKKIYKQVPYRYPTKTCGLVPYAEYYRQYTVEFLQQIGAESRFGFSDLLYNHIEL